METNYFGISQGFHDAGVAVVDNDGNILYAGHSERYSKIKNDSILHEELLDDALSYCGNSVEYHYYERRWLTNLRRLMIGQSLSSKHLLPRKTKSWNHHLSHAAAAFQTSPFEKSAVVVVDAIGEFETITIWKAHYNETGKAQYKKVWSRYYPHSIGLFYSAMTDRVGLKPMEDEYILMGMAAYGNPDILKYKMTADFLHSTDIGKFIYNFHKGCRDWEPEAKNEDIAAGTQFITESVLFHIHSLARILTESENVCLGGGVALNCTFNSKLSKIWNNVWICPNPGDCGSALGAAALGYRKKLKWNNTYLGHNIEGQLNVQAAITSLLNDGMIGVAKGKAEWGPRALGNRSLLADPRPLNMKDRVNQIKQRQKYRPFAPAILSEFANEYFQLDNFDYSYMQYAVSATKAIQYPSICHVDNTSRVQVVKPDNSNVRVLLEEWYKKTGCPILLNTSLNVKGQPIVNDKQDAKNWQEKHAIKVF